MSLYHIQTVSMAREKLDAFMQAQRLALDIETAGDNGLDPYRSEIRLIQLCDGTDTLILDMKHLPYLQELQTLLEAPQVLKIIHHAKFEQKHFWHHQRWVLSPVFCTFLAAKLVAPQVDHPSFSLKALCKRYLGVTLDKSEQTSDWSGLLTQRQLEYAAMDVAHLLVLHDILGKELAAKQLNKVSQLEFRVVFPLARMELNGLKIDWDQAAKEGQKLQEELSQVSQALQAELEPPGALPGLGWVTLDSPEQVLEALNAKGYQLESTKESELKARASGDQVVQRLLHYRHLKKVLTSGIQSLQKHRHPCTDRTHPNYQQIASISGRFACYDPNIQQLPREKQIRALVIPEPGNRFVVADYSQIELRVAAALSGDPLMTHAYREGQDLHALTASLTMGKPMTSVTRQERQAAKAINFGLIYAMGAAGLKRSAQQGYGVEMTLAEAEAFRRRFFEAYSGLKRWQEETLERVARQHMQRTIAGRIRDYRQGGMRPAEVLNFPVQGSAADILKAALILFEKDNQQSQRGGQLVAMIHDELIVEFPESSAQEGLLCLENAMLGAARWLFPDMPFVVDAAITGSWAEKA
jgi:DNA polymerase I-like protein with 3'-5' exonuclease and polymerase domains